MLFPPVMISAPFRAQPRMLKATLLNIFLQVSAFSTWEKELHKIVFDPRYLLLNSEERKQVRRGRGVVGGSGRAHLHGAPVPTGGCLPVCHVVSCGRRGRTVADGAYSLVSWYVGTMTGPGKVTPPCA